MVADITAPELKSVAKPPAKKVHTESGSTFVIFDKSLVDRLALDNDGVWLEQSIVDGGIFLRIVRKGGFNGDPV